MANWQNLQRRLFRDKRKREALSESKWINLFQNFPKKILKAQRFKEEVLMHIWPLVINTLLGTSDRMQTPT
jgi:hypothetical protein